MESNWNQLIERYLDGELSANGKEAFEAELSKSPSLQQELELHRLTQDLIRRSALRSVVVKRGKFHHLKKTITTSAIVIVVVAAIATTVLLTTKTSSPPTEDVPKQEVIETALLEEMTEKLEFEHIDPQYFKFMGENDVFLSESGALLSITENSFQLNGNPYNGEAVIQWQEAQTPAEIVKAGLSTTSGDNLLETQGMFTLNAFTPEGKSLELSNTGIYVQIPVAENKNGMLLFQGVKDDKGKVDWQNPQQIERLPIPKSMADMDLFPPKYEPKLNELKWFTDKSKRDSLYLSFDETLDTVSHGFTEWNTESNSANKSTSRADIASVPSDSVWFPKNFGAITGMDYSESKVESIIARGEQLFKAKCATCHNPHKEGTGPALFGVRQRWEKGKALPGSLYTWVVNQADAASKDPYAKNAMDITQAAMPSFPELTISDIDGIFDYVDSQSPSKKKYTKSHIPPSKVLAIWNTKFDNTILATQDFEKRMKVIHNTCDERVFDIYANNLHEPLWKLDQQVVKLGYPEFQKFADERVGKLNLNNAHQQNLKLFYEQAIKTIREKGKNATLNALKKEKKWDTDLNKERADEVYRKGMRDAINRKEESAFNLQNVSKQMGLVKSFTISRNTFPPRGNKNPRTKTVQRNYSKQELPRSFGKQSKTQNYSAFTGPIILNIDSQVANATTARKTSTIKDYHGGNQGEIKYSPLTASVENHKQYDKLFFYLFSKETTSYQRLDFKDGNLDYSLNDDMNYTAAIVGMNENGFFLHELKETMVADLSRSADVSLVEVSEAEFDKRINAMNMGRGSGSMEIQSEINWLFKEKANYTVQKQRRENAAFRAVVRPTIYSCEHIEGEMIPEPANEEPILDIVDEEASFPGGLQALTFYLNTNMVYPQRALDDGISGRVYLRFVVSSTGKITNVKVTRGIPNCSECDAEAKRVIQNMPNWIPAKNNGKNVGMWFNLPIKFSADGGNLFN